MTAVVLVLLGTLYALWVFYLAVMNLKRAKDAGQLSTTARIFGTPVLVIGYLLDAFVNTTLMTLVLLEMPRWPREVLVTDRLIRHYRESQGWRLKVVLWFKPLLDPYDPTGKHI